MRGRKSCLKSRISTPQKRPRRQHDFEAIHAEVARVDNPTAKSAMPATSKKAEEPRVTMPAGNTQQASAMMPSELAAAPTLVSSEAMSGLVCATLCASWPRTVSRIDLAAMWNVELEIHEGAAVALECDELCQLPSALVRPGEREHIAIIELFGFEHLGHQLATQEVLARGEISG